MSIRRTLTALGGAAGLGLALLLPAHSADAATWRNGAWFSYVSGQQNTTATGASVRMWQATPYEDSAYGHTLQELALQDAAQQSTIEVGWTVDPQVNGDYLPHLFVFHWVNGQVSCYNACGFVPAPGAPVKAGDRVTSGAEGTFMINHDATSHAWWIYYNGQAVGDYPDSLWNNQYTSAGLVNAFGEVADPHQTNCTRMGNGYWGSGPGSSYISNYYLIGSQDQPNFTVTDTDPNSYNYGNVTATSFTLGGPGSTCP